MSRESESEVRQRWVGHENWQQFGVSEHSGRFRAWGTDVRRADGAVVDRNQLDVALMFCIDNDRRHPCLYTLRPLELEFAQITFFDSCDLRQGLKDTFCSFLVGETQSTRYIYLRLKRGRITFLLFDGRGSDWNHILSVRTNKPVGRTYSLESDATSLTSPSFNDVNPVRPPTMTRQII